MAFSKAKTLSPPRHSVKVSCLTPPTTFYLLLGKSCPLSPGVCTVFFVCLLCARGVPYCWLPELAGNWPMDSGSEGGFAKEKTNEEEELAELEEANFIYL